MAIVVVGWLTFLVFYPVGVGEAAILFEIKEGSSLSEIATDLKSRGFIRSKTVFIFYTLALGEDKNLKAGRYSLPSRASTNRIVYILSQGLAEHDDIKITIPEGMNVWEMDKRLVQAGIIDESEFSSKYHSKEGYLFPDTYSLSNQQQETNDKQNRVEELSNKMTENFNNKTSQLLGGLSLAESREIIVIASILEKEARAKGDMKLVSGIIRKRLELGIPLQVDATVIYGACRRIAEEGNWSKNCEVTYQGPAIEILVDGPYNTYTRKGLPPLPISNPGLQAIEAALNPTPSDYLYYLSNRDGGQMIYSKTSGEHAANRRRFLGI